MAGDEAVGRLDGVLVLLRGPHPYGCGRRQVGAGGQVLSVRRAVVVDQAAAVAVPQAIGPRLGARGELVGPAHRRQRLPGAEVARGLLDGGPELVVGGDELLCDAVGRRARGGSPAARARPRVAEPTGAGEQRDHHQGVAPAFVGHCRQHSATGHPGARRSVAFPAAKKPAPEPQPGRVGREGAGGPGLG